MISPQTLSASKLLIGRETALFMVIMLCGQDIIRSLFGSCLWKLLLCLHFHISKHAVGYEETD